MIALVAEHAVDASAADVRSAAVWRSLVCDVPLDCPPALLVRSTPVGSVVLDFLDGGPRAWINVVRPKAGTTVGSSADRLEAWVARWG